VVGAKDKLGVMLCFSWEDGYQQFVLKKVQLADGTAINYNDSDAQQKDGSEEDEDEDKEEEEEDEDEEEEEEQSE
jgi:hypothetical protein